MLDAAKTAKEELEKAESEEDVKALVEKLTKVSDPIFTKFYQQNPEAAEEAARKAGFNPDDNNDDNGGMNGTVD